MCQWVDKSTDRAHSLCWANTKAAGSCIETPGLSCIRACFCCDRVPNTQETRPEYRHRRGISGKMRLGSWLPGTSSESLQSLPRKWIVTLSHKDVAGKRTWRAKLGGDASGASGEANPALFGAVGPEGGFLVVTGRRRVAAGPAWALGRRAFLGCSLVIGVLRVGGIGSEWMKLMNTHTPRRHNSLAQTMALLSGRDCGSR
ncbi:hypothetical protein VUR80DRAFT_2498 [Thermomyces stellatus]